jgi:aspartate 1-decarboxylase
MFKSKIHRATVTEADLHYIGSITIDEELLEAADILENEKVLVINLNNGARFETYVIAGQRGSGAVCPNGGGARLALPGDLIIIIAFACCTEKELKNFTPNIVHVDENNKIVNI